MAIAPGDEIGLEHMTNTISSFASNLAQVLLCWMASSTASLTASLSLSRPVFDTM